ncbi:ABC transporter permease [Tepidibacillus fermentans]|uniref:Oligopeptide transport system permease protein/dipeptide transport system permease protein n=1 Tax=Tepidibacillus fermentans TaxID=1281767 RepID=A0A4V2UT09_9BACI|nr:ABC transporter permease [Tepidibacillus fermentans]TCS83571.1 oligopeptide transport system permease protein/dipeptide transport system permease protein [Tepidibacillus fermentans]
MPEITKDSFKRIERDIHQSEQISRPSINFWQDAWRRLKKNKLAMFGLGIIIFLILMAIIGPHLIPYDYKTQNLSNTNQPISAKHWFGTDDLGRDVFARSWEGARISLFIGFAAAMFDLLIGVVYGGISGFKGGKIDQIMMRIVDVLYGLPYLIVVILLMVVMEQGLFPIIVALGATGWIGMARLVRGQILQLKQMEFVLAARTLGADTKRLLFTHLIPNTLGPIIVSMTLSVPGAIFGEAFLSFIGLGVTPPLASWGTMVNDAVVTIISGYWWRLFFPATLISLTMFAFNVFGDGLRDALDPKLRK